MRVKQGFILRKVGQQYVVAATGEASKNFNGMIRLNEEAAFAFGLLQKELERLQLAPFARCVEAITDCWFSDGTPLPEDMEEMARSILSAGTYGTVGGRVHNEMMQLRERFGSPLAVKLAYLFSSLFLPLKGMRELYPVLKKAPVLLPLFWIWRPISRLLFGRDRLKQFLNNTDKEGDKLWSEFDWRGFQSK